MFLILIALAIFNAVLLLLALALTTLFNVNHASVWRTVAWLSAASLVFAAYAIVTTF